MDKRSFLSAAGGASLGLMFGPSLLAQYATKPVSAVAEDEPFWAAVRGQFRLASQPVVTDDDRFAAIVCDQQMRWNRC